MTRIVVHLPFPISVNAVWRSNRGRVHRSKAYTAWLEQAGLHWLTQRQKQPRAIPGRFSAYIVLAEPKDKRRRDIDNTHKCLLDFCKTHKLIKDDYLCRKLYLRWGTLEEAPLGARLVLKDVR